MENFVNMKKTALIIGLIFVNSTCYAQEKRLDSDYTELIEWNGQGENNSKPFALEIELEKYHFLMMALVIMMSVDSMF